MQHEIEFEGIGTQWYIAIFDSLNEGKLQLLKNEVIASVTQFENLYSRFKKASIISKLNREKQLYNPSKEFLDLLNLAVKAEKVSKGHFNICVGKVLENLGYDSQYSFTLKTSQRIEESISILEDKILLSQDTSIDLGGLGKGYLIEKLKKVFNKNSIKYFFINAGGDIFATSNNNNPIEFFLENPLNQQEIIGRILIKNESIASSSNLRRRWIDNTNQPRSHLIDMVSKSNISKTIGVFTLSRSSINADIASTSLFVSPKDLNSSIASFYEVEYLIIYEDKTYFRSLGYSADLFI